MCTKIYNNKKETTKENFSTPLNSNQTFQTRITELKQSQPHLTTVQDIIEASMKLQIGFIAMGGNCVAE